MVRALLPAPGAITEGAALVEERDDVGVAGGCGVSETTGSGFRSISGSVVGDAGFSMVGFSSVTWDDFPQPESTRARATEPERTTDFIKKYAGAIAGPGMVI